MPPLPINCIRLPHSLVMTLVSQPVAAPTNIEPHPITFPSLYHSLVPEDMEGEARYPIVKAAHCPMMTPFQIGGVRPIPDRVQSSEDGSKMTTHITTQSMSLSSHLKASHISHAKAFTAQRIAYFTSSSSTCGRYHHADVLMAKTRGRVVLLMVFLDTGIE